MDEKIIKIKIKIIDMKYEKEDHIFIMNILDIEKNKTVKLAIKAEDFNINRKIPINIINNFCEEMKNKEKNLNIKSDNLYKGNNIKPSEIEVSKLQEEMDKYPYKELIRKSFSEG